MPATRSKRNSKEQAQLAAVSQALSQGNSASKRRSFHDDDHDADEEQRTAQPPSPAAASASSTHPVDGKDHGEDEDDDTADAEAPVEEVSNKSTKRKLASDSTKKKAERKAVEEKRKEAEQQRLQRRQQEAEALLEKQQRKKAKGSTQTADGASSEEQERRSPAEVDVVGSSQGEEQGSVDVPEPFDIEEDDLDADLDEPEEDGASWPAESAAGPSRLDPSLFAQVFAQRPGATTTTKSILKRRTADPVTAEMEEEERLRRKKLRAKRKGGIVQGRDGLPMRRLNDGTVVRSLSSHSASKLAGRKKTNFDDQDHGSADEPDKAAPLDLTVRPTVLDPSVSLPNAKVRGFKKRKLGLAQPPSDPLASAKAKAKKPSPKRDEDDPLGLNDPAFLPGGEFYKKPTRLTGARARKDPKDTGVGTPGALARQGFRGRGGRTDALTALSAGQKGGPALGFARSLA